MLVDDGDYKRVPEKAAQQNNTIRPKFGNFLYSRITGKDTHRVLLAQCSFVGGYLKRGVVSQWHDRSATMLFNRSASGTSLNEDKLHNNLIRNVGSRIYVKTYAINFPSFIVNKRKQSATGFLPFTKVNEKIGTSLCKAQQFIYLMKIFNWLHWHVLS